MSETAVRRTGRARQYAAFLRHIVGLHPRLFAVAVTGAFVFALCTVASSEAVRWVIDHVILPRFQEGSVATSTVIAGCSLIVGIGILRAAGVVLRRAFAHRTEWRIAETLSAEVTDRFVEQPVSWHQRRTDGDLVARAGVDTDTAVSVMAPIPFATGTVLLVVVSAIWMITVDPAMGLVAVTVLPLILAVNLVYERAVTRHFDEAQEALGAFSGAVHESFEAVQLVKAYGAEQRETDRLATMAGRIRDPRIRAVRLRGTFEAALEAIPSLTNVGLVLLGAARVDAGHLTIGELSGIVFMFTLLVFPLRLIGYALSELPMSYAGYRRIREIVDEPVAADPVASLGTSAAPAAVVFDDVWFTFDDATEPTILGANATIAAGSITVAVGATGSGKTTLIELIAGLVAPSQGRVAVPAGERALVFQEAFLFSGTVRENVCVDRDIPEPEIWEALRLADADGFVRELPDGLDTLVGERGVTLSGGQRQRVALARALSRRPALLLLDDTTSALDPATEQRVLARLRGALTTTTLVLVASRPSTIALAEDVLFVDGGRVVAHGTHAELMASQPAYRALVEAFEADRHGAPTEVAP